jgi:putative FmdB family regulatory protein
VPLYEYECNKCHHRFERLQRMSDPPVKECPECGGSVWQVLSPPAIQFKGSGWYVTDYAHKNSVPAPTNGNGSHSAHPAEAPKPAAKTVTAEKK